MELSKNDISFIIDALNFYWNDAAKRMMDEKDLGDLERGNLKYRKENSSLIMNKILMDKCDKKYSRDEVIEILCKRITIQGFPESPKVIKEEATTWFNENYPEL